MQHIPGKYEDFLQVIYEFESSTQRQTAVDLYKSLQILLQDWPQLLKDFAAFLLPEQALACGLVSREWGKDHALDPWVRARLGLGSVDQDCSRRLAVSVDSFPLVQGHKSLLLFKGWSSQLLFSPFLSM